MNITTSLQVLSSSQQDKCTKRAEVIAVRTEISEKTERDFKLFLKDFEDTFPMKAFMILKQSGRLQSGKFQNLCQNVY